MPCIASEKSAVLRVAASALLLIVATHAIATPIASTLERVQGERSADSDGNRPPIPQPLLAIARVDAREGVHDRVLNQMQAGALAFQFGDYDYAAPLFMSAHEQIETIYADDPAAKKARSKFSPDSTKDFKGDAYERAMLGYYLGLSYMMNDDMDNARASFRWGEFQDTMSASESYRSDMAGLTFLKGWISHCAGDTSTASEHFSAARSVRDSIAMPKEGDNLLVIIETGTSPVKTTSGKYNESLSFKRGSASSADSVAITYAEQQLIPGIAEDVYWQASTLGGRTVDKILAGKASFKQGAETTANVATSVAQVGMASANSAISSGNYDMANAMTGVAAASMLIGIGAKIFAAKAKPAADARYWNSLPDRILMTTTRYADQDTGSVQFSAGGAELSRQPLTVRKTGSCFVAWVREGVSATTTQFQTNQLQTNQTPTNAPVHNNLLNSQTATAQPPDSNELASESEQDEADQPKRKKRRKAKSSGESAGVITF